MSSDIAISVNNVSKCFHTYQKPLHRITQKAVGKRKQLYREFWALRDVTFDVLKGETFGIIGKNGSGKSTLLEIITDTLTATGGDVAVDGRIAALLELGAGFNPDFTGRENVFLNGAIMGVSKQEIEARYNDVVAFSEIGDFVDQPVKTYSSGMYVRLAFAAAINMDPDILIVDEALSVGDIRFQRKCFRKFEELKKAGKTILFVTHSTELINAHCDKAVFLDSGRIKKLGPPKEVVHAYLDFLFGADKDGKDEIAKIEKGEGITKSWQGSGIEELQYLNSDPNIDGCAKRKTYNDSEYRWGDGRARIIDYLVLVDGRRDPVICRTGERVDVLMKIFFKEPIEDLIYGLTVKTVDGLTVYGANTREKELAVARHTAGEYAVVRFSFENRLITGNYFVSLGVAKDDPEVDNAAIDRRYDLFNICVEGEKGVFGVADLGMRIEEV